MNFQQQSVNRYTLNWCLVDITSFACLRAFSASLIIATGIQALHNDLYMQLTAIWILAIISATIKSLGKLTSVNKKALNPAQASHDQEKLRLKYNDELVFYFDYCISFPGRYQDYTDPPLADYRDPGVSATSINPVHTMNTLG